ncbi:MAG: hypothetical protein NTZ55_04775 [Candidatus Roizmanbacteria bacterium]|nr:hypothetical protein [Candidatus Roizmanbacteria bacterium]
MKIHTILLTVFFFLLAVVLSELVLVYLIKHRPSIVGVVKNAPVPVSTATPQENNSCTNWYAKYKHIDSTSTTTRGVLSKIENNTKFTKIVFVSPDTDYYVLFENAVTQVKVSNSIGEPMKFSQLKQGDTLKVVEQYVKTTNNKESFSVLITKEK